MDEPSCRMRNFFRWMRSHPKATAGLTVLLVGWALGGAHLIPIKDPLLAEGLAPEN